MDVHLYISALISYCIHYLIILYIHLKEPVKVENLKVFFTLPSYCAHYLVIQQKSVQVENSKI